MEAVRITRGDLVAEVRREARGTWSVRVSQKEKFTGVSGRCKTRAKAITAARLLLGSMSTVPALRDKRGGKHAPSNL